MPAMENITVTATKRTVSGKQVKTLRTAGKLPAVLYGHNTPTEAIEVAEKDFNKAFKAAGESTLINLVVDGQTRPVLIHEVQHHYLNDQPIHVDFYAVNMDEKIKVKDVYDAVSIKISRQTSARLAPLNDERVEVNDVHHAIGIGIA